MQALFYGRYFFLIYRLNHLKSNVIGATAIEYTLIAVGVAGAIAALVFLLGADILGLFQAVSTAWA
jgi:Flp pilus assembly pilin Flp